MIKALLSSTKISLIVTCLFAAVLCGIYPLAVYGIGQLCFKTRAKGSLIEQAQGSKFLQGSMLIGQNFHSPRYFHPRPSAAGAAGYDALRSTGSNLGPTSKPLKELMENRERVYRQENALFPEQLVPVDAVMASGSGLDPHISVQNASLQTARVAKARQLSTEQVQAFVAACTEKSSFLWPGEERVNVLLLNLKLDAMQRLGTN